MVHVTFNENVQRHQYTPTPSIDDAQGTNVNDGRNNTEELASAISQGQTRFSYDRTFLKNLKESSLSQVCPDAVKKGIETGAGWAPKDQTRTIGNRSFFSKELTTHTNRIQRRPADLFYSTNRRLFGEEIFTPQPIGHNRYNTQPRNNQSRNYQREYGNYGNFPNRNFQPAFDQRYDSKTSYEMKNMQEEDTVPEWYRAGPTSRHDIVELHGFDENHENQPKYGNFGCDEGNISGGANSGASSHNSSPPAKSTPAKVTPISLKNDSQRNKRPALGRSNNWQNNYDNRHYGPAPFLNEFFKNFSATQNKPNVPALLPFVSVEDVESALIFERMKFRQMISQIQNQQHKNIFFPQQELVPNAAQVLIEIEKILRTNTDPIYERAEVRKLINNIVEAAIPPMNLMSILKNPLTEPQNRDTIVAALKLIGQAKYNATNAMKMHTPTESELRAHMDAILQDAIIKKRMENLNNELAKMPQQGGRGFPNQPQSFHQMFPVNYGGVTHNFSQGDSRGQTEPVENGATKSQDINLSRWFSQALLNKGRIGQFPKVPASEPLRSEELEIQQQSKISDKDVK